MSVPVLSIAEMRQWEAATWAAGVTEIAVIQNVGQLVAQRALRSTRQGDRILILAGKGHNGDDARAAQPHLIDREVVLLNVEEPLAAFEEFSLQLRNGPVALLIDALFGIGISRPLDEGWQKLIGVINDSRIPILSVDVPSGLNGDTGEPQGAAVRATTTLTIGAAKRGLVLTKAAEFVGRLEVAPEIGLLPWEQVFPAMKSREASGLMWIVPEDFTDFPPRRPVAGHKGSFGHVALIAGSFGYHGASVLATRGAQKAQPGLVTLITHENVYYPVASQLQAAMVRIWKAGQPLPESATALVFGPGLAAKEVTPAFKNELRGFWNESPLPVVADASALDWIPQGQVPKHPLRVITPHPGEAARLLKTTAQQVQADRPAAVRELSRRYGDCCVVLKGQQTLIGNSRGPMFINSSGNPFLAQGGSGDVLAGFLGGLLAQPALQGDPIKTICWGVWQHGATADWLTEQRKNWVVEDLVDALGIV